MDDDGDNDRESLNFTGVDSLSLASRKFYESTRMKMCLSFVFGSVSLMCLGLMSNIASRASAQRVMAKAYEGDDAIYTVMVNGFSFATFCHFVAFVLSAMATYLISPYTHGSHKEVSLLYKPKEVEHGE